MSLRSYLQGWDLDRSEGCAADEREDRAQRNNKHRACGLLAQLQDTPNMNLAGRPHSSGGALRDLQSCPMTHHAVDEYHRDTRQQYPRQAGMTVSTGFGRYINYSELAAINAGRWTFHPTPGGIVVAIEYGTCSDPYSFAWQVAQRPSAFNYVRHGNTLVPNHLGPADRELLDSA